MKSFSIFAFLLCVALCYSAPEPPSEQKYSTKFDNFDVQTVLKNKRLVASYVKCVLENVGCTAEGKTLREYLPDALKTNCAKCSEKQKHGSIQVLNSLEKDHPEEFKKVLDKFDPDRKLLEAFRKANPRT